MGQARRNKASRRMNPPRVFTSENLLGPVEEAVLGELKQGKPKPSVIVVDSTTEGTNWMPRVVDDVTGVAGSPAAMLIYATLEEFAKDAAINHPETLEPVRQRLTAYPDDVVLVTLDDHGLGIADIEMTAMHADGREMTLQQLSAAYAGAGKAAMDDLFEEGVGRAIDVYGLEGRTIKRDGATQEVVTLLTKGLLNVIVERTLSGREAGYHPAVIGIFPGDGGCEAGCWDTPEKFERTRSDSTRHRAWKEQVRDVRATYPDRIAVCWPPDALEKSLSLTAREKQSGWTVWAVDTESMQMERVG